MKIMELQALVPIKPETASGVVKITAVSHWAFAANDPILHRGCSGFSRRVASERIDYNYFRYYDPSTGRYTQSDRLGLFDGPNTYTYVYNNPLIYTDPTGEFGLVGAGIGAVIEVGIQLATNGGNVNCINWKHVAISAAVGFVAPGALASAGTAFKSAKAANKVQGQLNRARTANKRAKLARRIHSNNAEFTSALAVQGAWQGSKAVAKNNSSDTNSECGCNE
jgi:RHS repeat-associated protein